MDMDLEQQLSEALDTRAASLPISPADFGALRKRARTIRGRRAAGGAVAVAAAVVAVIVPLSLLGGQPGARDLQPVAPPSSTPSSEATPTQSQSTEAPECSSTGVAKPTQPAGLPPAVADTWQAIVDAAAACDFDALARLGSETTISFGLDRGARGLEKMERDGNGNLGVLLKVMATTGGVGEKTEDGSYYAWPALSLRSWGDVTPAERAELQTFHTDDEIASFDELNGYYGWRLGIRSDGTWMYFVAGD